MNRKMMLIINPHSGRGLTKIALGTIISKLCIANNNVTVHFTYEKKPEELAYEHADKHDLIVCVGGDGTLSGVIAGVVKAKASVPVGFIPTGTANDVANTFAQSKYPSIAAKKIMKGTPRAIDIGEFRAGGIAAGQTHTDKHPDRYFTYIAAF